MIPTEQAGAGATTASRRSGVRKRPAKSAVVPHARESPISGEIASPPSGRSSAAAPALTSPPALAGPGFETAVEKEQGGDRRQETQRRVPQAHRHVEHRERAAEENGHRAGAATEVPDRVEQQGEPCRPLRQQGDAVGGLDRQAIAEAVDPVRRVEHRRPVVVQEIAVGPLAENHQLQPRDVEPEFAEIDSRHDPVPGEEGREGQDRDGAERHRQPRSVLPRLGRAQQVPQDLFPETARARRPPERQEEERRNERGKGERGDEIVEAVLVGCRAQRTSPGHVPGEQEDAGQSERHGHCRSEEALRVLHGLSGGRAFGDGGVSGVPGR